MKALKKIYIALIMLFLYAPMLVMVVFSFNASNSTSVMSGFSLKWYVEMFRNATALTALRNTLVLAVTSALISIIIGTAAAVGINAMKKRWLRSAVMTVTNVPMMNPEIVTGVSMMLLFVFAPCCPSGCSFDRSTAISRRRRRFSAAHRPPRFSRLRFPISSPV